MKYVCQICGYVYDEDKEGVSFVGLPDDWKCPICKAAKSEFKELVEELNSAEEVEKTIIPQENIRVLEMSAGQMAALCTNFSRACEKQYRKKRLSSLLNWRSILLRSNLRFQTLMSRMLSQC